MGKIAGSFGSRHLFRSLRSSGQSSVSGANCRKRGINIQQRNSILRTSDDFRPLCAQFSSMTYRWNENTTKHAGKSSKEFKAEAEQIIQGAQDVLFPTPEKKINDDEKNKEHEDELKRGNYRSLESDRLKNLPSKIEARRSKLARTLSTKLDELQTAIFTAGRTINDITGYSEIDALRRAIERQGMHAYSLPKQ